MEVMFFLPHLDGGGAEMNAIRLAPGLLEQGIRPIYVVTHGPGGYAEYLPQDVEVIVLPTGAINSSTLRLVRSLRPLMHLIEKRRPDILCPVMPMPALIALTTTRCSSYKPLIVLSIQSTIRPPSHKRMNFVKLTERYLIPRMFPRADSVIALSRGVGNEIVAVVPQLSGKVSVVYNIGLPLEAQLTAPEINPPKPVPEGFIRFLACGRLVEAKGYPYLLEAFAQVSETLDAELHILGDGPMHKELLDLAKKLKIDNRVTFLGFRRNPFIHMHAANVFVLSSLWEGFGNVIIEAMSTATPVIATRCPHGPEEIITDNVNGLLAEPANSISLANAMRRLVLDPQLRERLSVAAVQRAQDFSYSHIASEYSEIFRRLVRKNHVNESAR